MQRNTSDDLLAVIKKKKRESRGKNAYMLNVVMVQNNNYVTVYKTDYAFQIGIKSN